MTAPAIMDTIADYLHGEDIHDIHRQKMGGTGMFLLVSIILLFFHAVNTYAFFWQHKPFALFAFVHVALAAVSWLYARARISSDLDARFPIILSMLTATTGVFGAGGAVLGAISLIGFNRYSRHFRDWFATIFPSIELSKSEQVHENLLTGRDESALRYSVIPFMEVMTVGSEDQKREALSRMTARFHPSFASAFRKGLNDDNNAIRVQAATSIAKIENQFLDQTIQIESLYQKMPKDKRVLLALARHYDEYAYTGILDPEREESNRSKALRAYQDYLEQFGQDANVRLFAGRLLLRTGRVAKAAEWFRQSIDMGFSTPHMLTWYMECLFKLRRYAELREFSARFHGQLNDTPAQPALAESALFWSTNGGTTA